MRIPHRKSIFALLLGLTLACGPALADKPDKGNHGRSENNAHNSHGGDARGADERQHERRDDNRQYDKRHDRRNSHESGRFNDRQRNDLHAYYAERSHSGHCPPGLAKKNNGCQPPGQAKKWRKGYALPRDVRYYDLPRDVLIHLGPPPSGHKYVRVASDILMIAIGTSMVVDAIDDLGR